MIEKTTFTNHRGLVFKLNIKAMVFKSSRPHQEKLQFL